MTGYGVAIADRTRLVAARDVAMLQDSNAVSFENKTIAFPLDLISGASYVQNKDNWGIGPRGVNAQLFWSEGARGQHIRIGIADSGIDISHPTFCALKSGGRLAAFAEFPMIRLRRRLATGTGRIVQLSQWVIAPAASSEEWRQTPHWRLCEC
jgi:hypothetical protein